MLNNLLTWFQNLVGKENFIEGSLKSEFIKQATKEDPQLIGFSSEDDWAVWEVTEGDYGYSSSILIDGKRLFGEW